MAVESDITNSGTISMLICTTATGGGRSSLTGGHLGMKSKFQRGRGLDHSHSARKLPKVGGISIKSAEVVDVIHADSLWLAGCKTELWAQREM